jgi:nucleotide-binding universal stress UspA family protein
MNTKIRHILIATDGSELSNRAAAYGIRLAKSLDAKVSAIHVIPQFHEFTYRSQMLLTYHAALPADTEENYLAATAAHADRILGVVRKTAAKAGVKCDASHVRHDQPWQAILETARKKRCDLIVMASHGRSGVGGVILGSEAHKLLVHSELPVLVWRGA